MSLLDLLRLCKKYWLFLLAAALICAALGVAYELLANEDNNETAVARVVGNSQTNSMTSLGNAVMRSILDPEDETDAEYQVSNSIPSGQTTLVVRVTGPDGDRCIEIANTIASETAEQAKVLFADFENPWAGYADLATRVEEKESAKASIKYGLVGLLAGLFVALCALLLQDLRRRSIKSLESMQDAVELPVLEKLPANNGDRLLANIRFASKKDDLASVSVVPLSDASPVAAVCSLLDEAHSSEKRSSEPLNIEVCAPLSASMDAAYSARNSDAVIVAAKQWDDSLKDLETTVAELQLAGTNLVGLVYAE